MTQFPFDLHSLRAFIAVCESQSMADAARVLNVTQSAISQLIKTLEKQCGMVLLDRDFRPLRPTADGLILLEMGKDLLRHAQSIAYRLSEPSQQTIVRLGCIDSFTGACGGLLIRALSNRVKEVSLWSGLTPALSNSLKQRELDIAICTLSQFTDPRISQRFLFSERFIAVVGKQYGQNKDMDQGDLLKIPLLRYSRRSVIGQQIERYLLHIGLTSPMKYEFDATDPILDMVSEGMGYCITTPLCLWQSRHYLDKLKVVPIKRSKQLDSRGFFCLSRVDEWQNLANQVEEVTKQIVKRHILPNLYEALPDLPSDIIDITSFHQ